jgi:hypothetical protein
MESEHDEKAQRECFNAELSLFLEGEKLPALPNELTVLQLENLPDLSEWSHT